MFKLAPLLISNIGYFRVVNNPKIVYEFIPGTFVDGGTINKQGFKDGDFSLIKATNLVRIAMLGDSITQGLYVEQEKTFSGQLEKLLNQRAAEIGSQLRYEVMNFGVGGYNLEAEVETLKTKVLKYSPDIVILNFFQNDDEPLPGLYAFFISEKTEFKEKETSLFLRKYFFDHSYPIINFVRTILYKSKLYLFFMDRTSNSKKIISKILNLCQKNQIGHCDENDIIYMNILEIKKMQEQHKFKFLICIHPNLIYEHSPNDDKVVYIAKLFNLPYFYMLEYYKNEIISLDSVQVKKDDAGHLNELGHLIVSKTIFSELKRNGFIDKNM